MKWIISLLAVLLLTGCGGAEPEAKEKQPEPTFTAAPEPPQGEHALSLSILRDQTETFDTWSDQQVIDSAEVICDGLTDLPMETVVLVTMSATESGPEAGALVAYAVIDHCPEHEAEFDEWAGVQ